MSQPIFAAQAALVAVAQAANMIRDGLTLLVAGDEALLRSLPKGKWIGGTIPYFMAETGGIISREQVFVHKLPPIITGIKIQNYAIDLLPNCLVDAPTNGFSVILLPAGSKVHESYACNAPNYAGMFLKPIIGWVTGVHLNDLGTVKPKVFNGAVGAGFEQEAVVLHATLPDDITASLGIINLFTQGNGDTLVFPHTSFTAAECLVNGQPHNLATYVQQLGLDTRLPIVANYNGAMFNVSFQAVDQVKGQVSFYAPVFADVEYKLATAVPDYVTSFQAALADHPSDLLFSCNCILNFLYAGLEGKQIGNLLGPMTFGEVAYQLLNQTLVYLKLDQV